MRKKGCQVLMHICRILRFLQIWIQTNRKKKTFPVQTPQLSNKFSRVKNTEESISSENEIVETDDVTGIQSGMSVYHERFGPGKVLQLEGKFPNTKATIFFQSSGQKQLLLKFAKLKIIE